MATAPRRRKKAVEPTEDAVAVLPPPAVEEAEREKVVLPEPVKSRWDELAAAATRKRVRVEVRVKQGTSPETVEGDLRGSFLAFAQSRWAPAAEGIGDFSLFSEAVAHLATWLEGVPALGADQLREELKAHSKKLALLDPADRRATKKLYETFRDRVLPLAWDNLVEGIKVEAMEELLRRVGAMTDRGATSTLELVEAYDVLANEARALVPPKEATDVG